MLAFGSKMIEFPILYGASIWLDMLAFIVSATLFGIAFFGFTPNKKPLRVLPTVLLSLLYAVFLAYFQIRQSDLFVAVADIGVLLPFIGCFLLFFDKQNKKTVGLSLIPPLICNLSTIPKYYAILLIPDFSQIQGSEAVKSMGIEYTVDAVMLVAAVVLVLVLRKKKIRALDFPMFLLSEFTVIIFTASIMSIYDHNQNAARLNYVLFLLNIPFFTVTVTYAVKKSDREKAKATAYKQMLDEQIKYYEMLEQKNNELRIYRHDFPKTVNPVIADLQNGDTAGAIEVLSTFAEKVQATRSAFHTGNGRLDAVLESQAAKAKAAGVTLKVTPGSVFPKSGMDSVDIYTLFPNLLDNAIEAAQKAGADSEIVFTAKTEDNTAYITVKNPFVGAVKAGKNGLVTTKKDTKNHGFGTQSIKKIAEKYGNQEVYITAENGLFTVGLVLELA